MVEANQYFEMDAGDSIEIDVTITKNSVALDITSLDIQFLLGVNELACGNAVTASVQKLSTVGSSEIEKVAPATQGIARIKLLKADTESLCGCYSFIVRVLDGSEPHTSSKGTVQINPVMGAPA